MVTDMFLILMRHGKAFPKKPGTSDFDRNLTPAGRTDVTLVARLIPVKPSVIYTSPFKRAVETAKEVARVMGDIDIKVEWSLEPERASLTSLRDLQILKHKVALIVGHAPSLDNIASTLIGGCRIKMPAGSALGIELDEIDYGKGLLKFFITPEVAEMI